MYMCMCTVLFRWSLTAVAAPYEWMDHCTHTLYTWHINCIHSLTIRPVCTLFATSGGCTFLFSDIVFTALAEVVFLKGWNISSYFPVTVLYRLPAINIGHWMNELFRGYTKCIGEKLGFFPAACHVNCIYQCGYCISPNTHLPICGKCKQNVPPGCFVRIHF